MVLAFLSLTIAIAKPYGHTTLASRTDGIDIMFVLDMSSSMKAYDYPLEELRTRIDAREPVLNRFETAVSTMKQFVSHESGLCSYSADRPRCDRIGLIVFGNEAFMDIPLTNSYDLFEKMLDRRHIGDIESIQTAIGDGIFRAVASLRRTVSESRIIILLTDGDQKGGRMSISQSVDAAELYRVKVFPILIGSEGDSYVRTGGADSTTFQKADFPTDYPLLESIARQTGGQAYRSASDTELLSSLDAIIDSLERGISNDPNFENKLDFSRLFILLTFVFVVVGYFFYFTFTRSYP